MKKEDGSVKLLIYCKPTHNDAVLKLQVTPHSSSKLGVIRTLFDRKDRIVTEDDDKVQEEGKVVWALKNCGYPKWTFKKVKDQMKVPKKQNTSKKVDSTNKSRGMVVIPYIQGVSERVARVYKSYGIAAAMKPHNTLRKELVHPKDKRDPENITDAIHECPCMNFELSYIGEMGRKFGTRLEEHKTEVEKVCKKVITRAGQKESLTTTHKSAITDHVLSDWGGKGH